MRLVIVPKILCLVIVNRPGVAGAVLKTPLSLINSFSQSVSQSAFSSESSKYHKSQTVRARELKFLENVHPPLHVTWGLPQLFSTVTVTICCMVL